MRELIVTEFITLDGVIEAPGGRPTHRHTGWVGDFIGPEQMHQLDEVLEARRSCSGASRTTASPRHGRRARVSRGQDERYAGGTSRRRR